MQYADAKDGNFLVICNFLIVLLLLLWFGNLFIIIKYYLSDGLTIICAYIFIKFNSSFLQTYSKRSYSF